MLNDYFRQLRERIAGNTTFIREDAVPIAGRVGIQSHTPMRMVAITVGMYLCYRLAVPFMSSLVWALALAVAFTPLYKWIEARLRRRALSAALCVIAAALAVIIPMTVVAERLVNEVSKSAEVITAKVESGDWNSSLVSHPRLAVLIDKIEREVDLPGMIKTIAAWLTTMAGAILKGSLVQVVGFLMTFYLLFFFLRDRDAAILSLRTLSPLSEEEMDRLLVRVGDTIFATIYGTLVVSAAQGLLGGLMFWWLGLPTPLLWGTIMALLAVIPVLGAFVVWVPAALYLLLTGNWGQAVILILWGGVVVSMTDNLLRPILVGGRLKLHTVLLFISLVGGVILFGASGLILGPVVLTVTSALLESWHSRTAAELAANEGEVDALDKNVTAGSV